MGKLIDLTGKRFGKLTVIGRAPNKNGRIMWNCICDCGNTKVVGGKDMKSGMTTSCGCRRKCISVPPPVMIGENNPSYKHGKSKTKLYYVWASMIQRCENENNNGFLRYGGRGIHVCNEWKDFSKFNDWAMSSGYREGLSIDRIDNTSGYSPENCRWVDSFIQSNNRRCNILISRCGETHTLAEWAKIKKLPYKTILKRYHTHGDTEDLFSEVIK